MKIVTAKVGKVRKAKPNRRTGTTAGLFIGARKSGSQVTVSREITQRSSTGHLTIIRSTKGKLPKTSPSSALKAAPKDWMQDPQLGDRLTSVFGKAVIAAKRRSSKRHG
jgi:hypothetical protein